MEIALTVVLRSDVFGISTTLNSGAKSFVPFVKVNEYIIPPNNLFASLEV